MGRTGGMEGGEEAERDVRRANMMGIKGWELVGVMTGREIKARNRRRGRFK